VAFLASKTDLSIRCSKLMGIEGEVSFLLNKLLWLEKVWGI
jgi:hypothetical protein